MTTRNQLKDKGERFRHDNELFGSDSDTAPGYQRMLSEVVYGGIWTRGSLVLEDRFLCVLSALTLKQNKMQLSRYLKVALNTKLTPRSIVEIFVQCGLYGGFPLAENAMAIAHDIFNQAGLKIDKEEDTENTLEEFFETGNEMLFTLHGERGTFGYADPANPTTGKLYEMAIQYGYGWLWHRNGLDRRQRMICAIASFTVLHLESQVQKFGQSALNIGFTKEEVTEVIMQTAPYSGFPPALNALAALDEVFR